jgi:fructose-1,6-bisphosphatase/inositol monophosphatase family enzyme
MLQNLERVSQIIKTTAKLDILPKFRKLKDFEITTKKSGEIVTTVDILAEKRLTSELSRLVPGSVVVGEESVSDNPLLLKKLKDDRPVWIIDPLDGTRNFAKGKECYAIIVAFCHAGSTLAGWIYDPAEDIMLSACKGQGARVNDRVFKVPSTPEIKYMSGSASQYNSNRLNNCHENANIPKHMLRYGCVGKEYIDLILGNLHFAEYGNLKPWDHAAGVLIHAESGGFSRFIPDGTEYKPISIIKNEFLLCANESDWNSLSYLFEQSCANRFN